MVQCDSITIVKLAKDISVAVCFAIPQSKTRQCCVSLCFESTVCLHRKKLNSFPAKRALLSLLIVKLISADSGWLANELAHTLRYYSVSMRNAKCKHAEPPPFFVQLNKKVTIETFLFSMYIYIW